MNLQIVKVIALIALFVSLCFPACAKSPETLVSKEEWKEDLLVFEQKLRENHIDLFHSISEEHFVSKLNEIADDFVEDQFQKSLIDMMRLTRQIGDGHTTFPLWGLTQQQLPITFSFIDGEYYVTSATGRYEKLLGSKLVALNSIPVLDLENQIGQIVPFVENEHSRRVRTARGLSDEVLLQGLGIVGRHSSEVSIELKKSGAILSQTLELMSRKAFESSEKKSIANRNTNDFETVFKTNERLWFGQHKTDPTILINFGRYPNYDEAHLLGNALIEHIREQGTQTIIIDLRDNYGGDFFLGLLLASYLNLADSVDWRNGVFVLTNGKTFSAAMSNTSQFKEILNARVVGGATGAAPCGYQDMGSFVLPHSKLEVTYSKRKFCFEQSKTDAIEPDFPIEVSIDDYLKSKDAALEWVLSYTSE
ncbi:S41 family peptidase [Hirschia maritima]|uniref:hypothetical protein n=1 Tax=Hirschia maritima TaxID=1121961 RepID=UPI00036AB3E0|nr:hypothetical protein [Hirschia maritima]